MTLEQLQDTRDWQHLDDGRIVAMGRTYKSESHAESARKKRMIPLLKQAYRECGGRLYWSQSQQTWCLTSDKPLPKELGTRGIPGVHRVVADISFFSDIEQGMNSLNAMIEHLKTAP